MNAPKGFKFNLQPYCDYCGDFSVDMSQLEVTNIEDKFSRYITTIYCRNSEKCERLKNRFNTTVKEDKPIE